MFLIYFKYYDQISGYVDDIIKMKVENTDAVNIFDHNIFNNNVFAFQNGDFPDIMNAIQENVNYLKLHIARNINDKHLLNSLLNKHPLVFIDEYNNSIDKSEKILAADILALESQQAVLDLAHVKYIG